MSTTIEQAFVKQFEREVHESYQRMGSKLRNTVRTKTGVQGSTTVFQKVGKGVANTKTRHSKIKVMNLEYTPVECQLVDYYAGEWIDRLDELKTNLDERQVVANAGAYALGRRSDELIINALNGVNDDRLVEASGSGLSLEKILAAYRALNEADVPDDGQRFAIVGPAQWSDLLSIKEFASSEYIGVDALPWRGTQAKAWLGTLWMYHSALPAASGVRSCFWYHKSAVGHAIGSEVVTDIDWYGDMAAHFVSNYMSQGACLVDETGVVKIDCLEA